MFESCYIRLQLDIYFTRLSIGCQTIERMFASAKPKMVDAFMQVEIEDKRPLRLEEEIDPKSSPERDQEEDPEYEPMSSPVTSDIGSDDQGMQETRLGFFYKSNKPCIYF